MTKCKDCGVKIEVIDFSVRCPKCKKKNTEKRKYKRRHIHRSKALSFAGNNSNYMG